MNKTYKKRIAESETQMINRFTNFRGKAKLNWNYFAKNVLGVFLDPDQKKILTAIQNNRRVSVRTGNAWGKDFVAAVASLCFLYLNRPSKVICTAPTQKQVRMVMMAEISKIYKNAKKKLGGTLLVDRIKFEETDWYLQGFKAADKDVEAWGGFHSPHLLVVVTEASGLEEESFEAIEGILTGDSKLVLLFNPHKNSGEAYQSTKDPQYVSFKMSCMDALNVKKRKTLIPGQVGYVWVNEHVHKRGLTTKIDKSEVNKAMFDFKWEGEWYRPSDWFLVHVLGEFPRTSENSLIPLSWIEDANERWLEDHRVDKDTPLKLGVDIAGMGADREVYAYRYENIIEKFDTYAKSDSMESVGKIKNIIESNFGIANIDTIGEGAGVFSRLEELKVDCACCKGSYTAKDLLDITDTRTFLNMRSYVFWALRDALDPQFDDIRKPLHLPINDELTQELTEIGWKVNSNGSIQIESNDDIKKRLGRSPDLAVALSLTYWEGDEGVTEGCVYT